MQPARVVSYLPELVANGGVSTHVLQLTEELARRGHPIDMLSGEDGDLGSEFRSFCESVTIGRSIRYGHSPVADLRGISKGVWKAARARPDVIYANNFTDMVWAGLTKRLARASSVVLQLHEFAEFRQGSMARLGREADAIVLASEFLKGTWVRHGLEHPRIEVVPCGVDLGDYPRGGVAEREQARGALGLPADAYIVLYFGRVIPEKGVDVLLEAWRKLGLTPEQGRLILLGGAAPGADGAAYIAQLQEQEPPGCVWMEMRPDVVSALHAADVVAVPSVWDEPFGRVIIEAMATGRPVVASRVGGIPEVLDGPFSEFLFKRGAASELAALLEGLRDWRNDRPSLADECVEWVSERYSLAGLATAIEHLFSA